MICWSVTAFAAADPDDVILAAEAATSLLDARTAAGDAALAALDDLAGTHPDSPPILSISIDDDPVLIAAAGQAHAGVVDRQPLIDLIHDVQRPTSYADVQFPE